MSDDRERQWFHDLRNAFNALCVTAAVMNRVLAEGRIERARQLAKDMELSCERCRELMNHPPRE